MSEFLFESHSPRIARVVVVESFPLVRTAIAQVLDADGALVVVGEAPSVRFGARLAEDNRADIVVTEAHIDEPNDGFMLCRLLKASPLPPKVVIYTADRSARAVADSVAAGADSFVHKSVEPGQFVAAVGSARQRERCWLLGEEPDAPTGQPAARASVGRDAAVPGLTERERQILALLIRRTTNEEIGAELCLARQTVKNHVSSVLRKLGASNRRELYARVSSADRGSADRPVRSVVAAKGA